MIIYKIKNKINHKCYIGQTTRLLYIRIKQHFNHSKDLSSLVLYRSFKKYGNDNFEWDMICECITKKELNEMEFHYIKQYHSHISEYGYNMTWGGDGGDCGNQYTKSGCQTNQELYGDIKAEEISTKHSKSCKGDNHYTKKYMTPDERDTWIKNRTGDKNPMYGKKREHSEETKLKMSESSKGQIISDNTRIKIGNKNRGSGNGMSGSYKMIKSDGEVILITGLLDYCRKHNTTPYKLKKKYKIVRI